MNCVIPGANMKVMSKAIQALSKIGDELHLEARQDYLMLRTANMTTTAYCTFQFHDTFFSSYEIEDSQKIDDLGCMMPMKAVQGVFKSHGHRDKRPEICKIELEPNASEIVFRLKYKHSVVVTRTLRLSDGQIVNVTYTKFASNQISANAQLFAQVLTNFQMSDEDMGIEVSSNKALMRNYVAGDINKPKGIRSQLTLTAGEFSSFKIGQETSITYSLKPFRAAIHFAETFNLGVLLNFDKCGKPAVLIIRNPIFEANFVIATLNTDHASQSSLSSAATGKKKNQKMDAANMTLQDQQVLESVNWDNDFDLQSSEMATKKNQFDDLINKARHSTNLNDNNNIPDVRNMVIEEQPRICRNENKNDEDVIGNSPESPRSKRIKTIFGRCYETTFHTTMMDLGEILAPDSDPESN